MKKRHDNNGLRKLCACARRNWPKCSHPWHFNFKLPGGKAYRFSLDKYAGKHIENKSHAEALADKLRDEIREGTFGKPAPRKETTLADLFDTYLERYVRVERLSREAAFLTARNTICRTTIAHPSGRNIALGEWRVADIVTDTIERFRETRRGQGTGAVGVNRNLESLRAMFNWAMKVGYLERTPFRKESVALVKLSEEHSRTRRLDSDTDEEARLLNACGPHLRAIVEAALETGMRRGEILSLQWSQVEGLKVEKTDDGNHKLTWATRAEIVLPWAKTKTKRERRIPVSSRLRSVLEIRRLDPSGEPLAPAAYVFGNEIGQQVENVKRAWQTAVLRSHGYAPKFSKTGNLTPEGRKELDRIDLHFHDLRREAGSRWLEGGVPLHTVRDWLGHTSIAQTSTYLSGTLATQHDAMRQFEERRSALQRIATDSGTGGINAAQSASKSDENLNKTAIDRKAPVM